MSSQFSRRASHSAPQPNFNMLARPYRWLEYLTFGPFLARTRSAYLPRLAHCRNALALGDGDGRFTLQLLRVNPSVRVRAVDASPAMLNALVRRVKSHAERVSTHIGDARRWQPGPEEPLYDAIVTHFFLDCLTTAEIQSMSEALRPLIAPSAVWIVSEFAIPPSLFGRIVARPLVWGLYRIFAAITGLTVRTLPDHICALEAARFVLRERQTRLAGLLVSEVWSPAPDA